MRRAFTLIEVMVSVVLISIVVTGIIKIQKDSIFMAKYIAGRVQAELSNTLFLTPSAMRYDKSEKDAYTVLEYMHIKKTESRELLREIKRTINISDPIPLGELPIPIELRAMMLKNKYSGRFYHINMGK